MDSDFAARFSVLSKRLQSRSGSFTGFFYLFLLSLITRKCGRILEDRRARNGVFLAIGRVGGGVGFCFVNF